jgi:hypothetical protein
MRLLLVVRCIQEPFVRRNHAVFGCALSRYDTEHTRTERDVPCPPPLRRHWPWVKQQQELQDTASTRRDGVPFIDACCLAKAYGRLAFTKSGQGPGPGADGISFSVSALSHRGHESGQDLPAFRPISLFGSTFIFERQSSVLGRILPIVNTGDWVERLCSVSQASSDGHSTAHQDETDPRKSWRCAASRTACAAAGIRLWINDYWQAAVEAGCWCARGTGSW